MLEAPDFGQLRGNTIQNVMIAIQFAAQFFLELIDFGRFQLYNFVRVTATSQCRFDGGRYSIALNQKLRKSNQNDKCMPKLVITYFCTTNTTMAHGRWAQCAEHLERLTSASISATRLAYSQEICLEWLKFAMSLPTSRFIRSITLFATFLIFFRRICNLCEALQFIRNDWSRPFEKIQFETIRSPMWSFDSSMTWTHQLSFAWFT